MANSERKRRLELARKLREAADHSSEQELRDALSRSYYSLYHAARVMIGREQGGLGHDGLLKKVADIDGELARTLRELHRLRENADYNPNMVFRDYGGDLERFRQAVNESLDKARTAYQRILSKIIGRPQGTK